MISAAYIFSSSGLFSIANLLGEENEGKIYYGLGIFFLVVAFFCLYAVKDVVNDDEILLAAQRKSLSDRSNSSSTLMASPKSDNSRLG